MKTDAEARKTSPSIPVNNRYNPGQDITSDNWLPINAVLHYSFKISATSISKKEFFPLPLKDHKDWGHLLIFSRTTLGRHNYVLCFPAMLPTAKSILMKQADPPWSPCMCPDMICGPSAVNDTFIVYKGSKAQRGAVYPFGSWVRKSVATAQWTPLSGACILRGTKGINGIAVCFAMLWAAFQCISKGSIRNVLSRLRDRKQYSQWAIGSCSFLSVGIAREGVEGDCVTFKFHTGELLPSGLQDRCSLGAISCDSGAV